MKWSMTINHSSDSGKDKGKTTTKSAGKSGGKGSPASSSSPPSTSSSSVPGPALTLPPQSGKSYASVSASSAGIPTFTNGAKPVPSPKPQNGQSPTRMGKANPTKPALSTTMNTGQKVQPKAQAKPGVLSGGKNKGGKPIASGSDKKGRSSASSPSSGTSKTAKSQVKKPTGASSKKNPGKPPASQPKLPTKPGQTGPILGTASMNNASLASVPGVGSQNGVSNNLGSQLPATPVGSMLPNSPPKEPKTTPENDAARSQQSSILKKKMNMERQGNVLTAREVDAGGVKTYPPLLPFN